MCSSFPVVVAHLRAAAAAEWYRGGMKAGGMPKRARTLRRAARADVSVRGRAIPHSVHRRGEAATDLPEQHVAGFGPARDEARAGEERAGRAGWPLSRAGPAEDAADVIEHVAPHVVGVDWGEAAYAEQEVRIAGGEAGPCGGIVGLGQGP